MKKITTLIFCIILILSSTVSADFSYEEIIDDTAQYILKTATEPKIGSVGGEWTILGLAKSGYKVLDEYYQTYYENVCRELVDCNGVLDERKHTEYSRVILALSAIGKNPSDICGFNLLIPLGDYEKIIWQGLNGPAWALIALDSADYEIPENKSAKIQASRDMYIKYILESQNSDGGWGLGGSSSDVDVTAMLLQALSAYQNLETVKTASDRALLWLSDEQTENAGFLSDGIENCESCSQVILALYKLGISFEDQRFVKNGKTVLDNLSDFYVPQNGFLHSLSESSTNFMATEQALLALGTVFGKASTTPKISEDIKGLANKHKDITVSDIIYPDKAFIDTSATSVSQLSKRGIINGKSDNIFDPDGFMTRAEFAAIIVRGLGLNPEVEQIFDDVSINTWFCGYIAAANRYGIVNGVSKKEFNPNGTITRQEAATMITRASALCGFKTDLTDNETRDILAGFTDYITVAEWAKEALAFCYRENILSDEAIEIIPENMVTRLEISDMLYNMLCRARLI